jgi:Tol biopolymer transport system component
MRLAPRHRLFAAALFLAGCGQVVIVTAPGPQQIAPTMIRVEPLGGQEPGAWLELADYRENGSPTLSRDGQWVAFDAYPKGSNNSQAECWVVRRDGQELHKLAQGATPRWSPDGTQLLFMREKENDPQAELGVFVIQADRSGEKRICDGRWPDWSPDGKKIVFATGGQRGGGARVGAKVSIANADGTGVKQIANGDCPSWSPDGKKIACCDYDPKRPAPIVRVVNLADGKETIAGYGWFRANWSADSKTLVCNGIVGPQTAGMVRLAADRSREPQAIFGDFRGGTSPCESFDGKTMVFIAERPAAESSK